MAGGRATSERTRGGNLERLLSVVTEVRRGESGTSLLLTLNVFLVLAAYYMIKPVREALILTSPHGPEIKSYASAIMAVTLVLAVPLYGRLANLLRRNRLVITVAVFFAACLVVFYLLGSDTRLRAALGVPFFVWSGIFNMMMVAQFWAFANDIYTPEQGQRLFALIGLGASLGALVGSKVGSLLLGLFGLMPLLLAAAALVAGSAALTEWAHLRERHRPRHAVDPLLGDGHGAFALVLRHRYLWLLALFAILYTLVNTNGEYILGKVVAASVPPDLLDANLRREWVAGFFADFYFRVNLIGMLLQALLVSRLVRRGGMSLAFFFVPAVALTSALTIFVAPVLLVVSTSKQLENATDYSVNNTVRHMLWLPTSEPMKYKAKQAVDTFFVRMGDVASALLVFTGSELMQLPIRGFAIVNIVCVAAWLVLGRRLMRQRQAMMQAAGHAGDTSS